MAFAQPNVLLNPAVKRSSRETEVATTPDAHGNVGWEFSKTPAPPLAEMLLDRLMEECKVDERLRPSIVTFNTCINIYARSGAPNAPEKAEALLRKTQELSKLDGWEDLQATNSTYSAVINTWANSGSEDATYRAEALLDEMKSSKVAELCPNGEIYLGVLKAWGRSQDPSAGKRTSELLQEMVNRYQRQRDHISDYVKENSTEAVVTTREKQTIFNCFLAVMNIFAKRGDAKHSSDILDQLQNLYEEWDLDKQLCPNTYAFNCVLRAWSKSRSRDAAVNAEAILRRMQDLAESSGNSDVAADLQSFNAVLVSP
jgi:hypothetical protein